MRTFFDKYFFEIDSFLQKALRMKHNIGKELEKGRYATTERVFRLVAT